MPKKLSINISTYNEETTIQEFMTNVLKDDFNKQYLKINYCRK